MWYIFSGIFELSTTDNCVSEMGIELSKVKSSKETQTDLDIHFNNSVWEERVCIPYSGWKCGAYLGFDIFHHWQIANFKVNKFLSHFSVNYKNERKKQEKLCSFSTEVFTTGRKERMSGWLKHASVISVHARVVVVQLVLSKHVKILVVDWHENKLLGTYTFTFYREACVQECFISPDGLTLLLRQNFFKRRCLGHVACFDSSIRIIQLKDGLCLRTSLIEDSLVSNTFGSGISFDPRYHTGRAVIYSSSLQTLDDDAQGVRIYDVMQDDVVRSFPTVISSIIHHIQHSPDGQYLAVLCVGGGPALPNLLLHHVKILDTDNFSLLHNIDLLSEPCKPWFAEVFPCFSRNCDFLAVYTGNTRNEIRLVKLPNQEMQLQHICRRTILRCTSIRHIKLLPLPKAMLNYLQYLEENVECSNVCTRTLRY